MANDLQVIESACDLGLGIFETVVNGIDTMVSTVGGYIDADRERRAVTERQFEEHEYNLRLSEIQRQEAEIRRDEAEIQAKKELKISQMENETEQLRIMEQSKCLQKAMDVALAAYTRKIDFYEAQLKSCDDFFKPQIAAMHQEIRNLEGKLDLAFGDTKQYILIQKQITRLTDYCNEVNSKYLKLHGELTTAVKLAQLDAPDANMLSIENTGTKLIG